MYPFYRSTLILPRCWVWSAITLGGALTAFLLLVFLVTPVPAVQAQSINNADVIVQFDNSARTVRAITFTEPISGLAALQLSGLAVVTTSTSFGPAVCSIQGVGCPAEDCFCNASHFWSYTYWDGSAWQSYPVGAGSSVISQTGTIEGWRWGEWGAPQIAPTQTLAAAEALVWLQARQSITNGGYIGIGSSLETMLAIGANQLAATAWRRSPMSPSLADFVAINGAAYTRATGGGAGKLAVATTASAACFPAVGIAPLSHYSPTIGTFSPQSGPNSWAILGTVAVSETVPMSATAALKAQQQADGGWEWGPGWGTDTNATSLAVQALIATGEAISSSTVISGLAFLDSAQNQDGGFPYAPGAASPSDANSTAYVVQGLIAAGEDPLSARWTVNDQTPIRYLLSLQLADGSFEWQAGLGPNQLATQQVIPALLGRAHPALRTPLDACPALYLPLVVSE
ncbi:MAG: hypothetical protein KF832_26300 [Caldilineaceae bacterium]|nr:hypothetical protein [Caldilineaceae bacterium]